MVKSGFTVMEVLISLVIVVVFFTMLYMITSVLLKNSLEGYAQGIMVEKILNANYVAWDNDYENIQASEFEGILEGSLGSEPLFLKNVDVSDITSTYDLTSLKIEDQIKIFEVELSIAQNLNRKLFYK